MFVYKDLVKGWAKNLPLLAQELRKGNVWRYSMGISLELTEEQQIKIKEIEERLKSLDADAKVVAVLEGKYKMSDGEVLEMESYIYLSPKTRQLERYEGKVHLAPALVINKTWNVQEHGDVLIKEVSGLLMRVG